MSEPPPRLKQKQKQKQPASKLQHSPTESLEASQVGTSSDTKTFSTVASAARSSQATKPPGFETTTVNSTTDKTSEWPDLLALNISSAVAKQTSAQPVARIQPLNIGYNPVEQSHFLHLRGVSALPSANNNLTSLPIPGFQRSKASLSGAVAANIEVPPGFVTSEWESIHKDSIYKTPPSSNLPVHERVANGVDMRFPQVVTEGSVINQVRQALDNDRERFNYFRNLSGWYRNSEITVQEYVRRCRELFGDLKWMLIGHQLAQVMPIEGKRNELLQNVYVGQFRSPMTSTNYVRPLQITPPQRMPMPNTNPAPAPIHVSRSEPALLQAGMAKWGVLANRVVPNWESEMEYPTLHSRPAATGMRGQVQPPGLPAHSWKARVPV
jgi:hypothetical protein